MDEVERQRVGMLRCNLSPLSDGGYPVWARAGRTHFQLRPMPLRREQSITIARQKIRVPFMLCAIRRFL